MGRMKQLSIEIDGICGACQSQQCNGCKMRIDMGDRYVYVNGATHAITGVENKKCERAGELILESMRGRN